MKWYSPTLSNKCKLMLLKDNHLSPIRMDKLKKTEIISVGKDVEQLEFLYTAGGNTKWYHCFGKLYGNFLSN